MLKIDFFPPEIIKDYEDEIAEKVRSKNGGKDDIIFIPKEIKNPNTGDPYKISIHDLLTLDRDNIFKTDGIMLYMCICSAQKYKSMSNVKLLDTLNSEYPKKVIKIKHEHGNYKYEINMVSYHTTRIDDKSNHLIIGEAANIIKNEFAKYNTNYAKKYFKNKINCVDKLNAVLDKMFSDANTLLNGTRGSFGTQESFIEYSMIPNDLRHKLMSSLGIRTCPYCNRNYITVYGKGKKSTADLDHFYQKKQYPLFALSLFNFIPSCQICNSRMKNTHSAENTLYPYKEGFEKDAHFELKYTGKNKTGADILHLWQAIKDIKYSDYNIEIVIDPATSPEKKKRIENSTELFHLTQVYEDHKPEALEAALRTRIYCEGSYKKFCEKLFDKCENFGMNNTSVSDLESCLLREDFDNEWLMFGIFMNDEKRKYDKPLSRMICDIYHSRK